MSDARDKLVAELCGVRVANLPLDTGARDFEAVAVNMRDYARIVGEFVETIGDELKAHGCDRLNPLFQAALVREAIGDLENAANDRADMRAKETAE